MEKFSSFERVVGNIPQENKEKMIKKMEGEFQNQEFEGLEGKELKKTPEQVQIISLANEFTNEIRIKYGLDYFDIPEKNIHIIKNKDWEDWKENDQSRKGLLAVYVPEKQTIGIGEDPNNIIFLSKVFHELLHFKSYGALQRTMGENSKFTNYRTGFTVKERNGEKIYFESLNEAITEELTKRFTNKLYFNPLFSKELNQTRKAISKYPNAVNNQGELLLRNSDIFYAEIEEKTLGEVINDFFKKVLSKETMSKIKTEKFSYARERRNLNVLIDKLFERNRERFKNREEVFELFVEGMVTGNILPVGKLIEKTFGNGTFRKIGEMDDDVDKQAEFIDSLF